MDFLRALFQRVPQCRSCHREGENVLYLNTHMHWHSCLFGDWIWTPNPQSTADISPLILIYFYFWCVSHTFRLMLSASLRTHMQSCHFIQYFHTNKHKVCQCVSHLVRPLVHSWPLRAFIKVEQYVLTASGLSVSNRHRERNRKTGSMDR